MANGAKNEAVGADKLPDFKQSQKDKKDKQLVILQIYRDLVRIL